MREVRAGIARLLVGWCACAGAEAASPDMPALKARVTTVLADNHLVGASWALVEGDSILVDAAGTRDVRSGAALAPADRMQVGSVAKTVLATGILKLVTDDRLSLDAPVETLLPSISFDNAFTEPVRVRHLLDGTSGLADSRIGQIFSLDASPDEPLTTTFSGRNARLKIRSRPGARFTYTNTGFTLLGMIIETTTGERYETWLDRELLRPLGLVHSTFGFVTQDGVGGDATMALGHFENGEAYAAVPIHVRPATQFTTTPADMGRFAQFLLGDGRIGGRAFVDRALLRAMGRAQGTEAANAGLAVGYALALNLRDRHGVVGRCHSGNTVGFRAMLCVFDEQRRAFFVAVNTDSETADYDRLDAEIIRALGIPPVEPEDGTAAFDVARWEGLYVPAPNRFASTEWIDRLFGYVSLRTREGQIQLATLGGEPVRLVPSGGDRLRATGRTQSSHVLLRAADDARILATGTRNYERVSTLRFLLPWVSLAAGAIGMAWILVSGLARALAWALPPRHPVFAPLVGLLALAVPVPFFATQPFLKLGDVTPASLSLALVTALLPLAALIGLFLHVRRRPAGRWAAADAIAIVALLQLCAVLAYERLIPLRLFAV